MQEQLMDFDTIQAWKIYPKQDFKLDIEMYAEI